MGRIAVATFLALVLWASCAHAQDEGTGPGTMHVTRFALAWTGCDWEGVPRSWVRTDLPDSVRVDVDRHEAMHRRQAARWPSCWAYEAAWKASPALQLELEAEAYCTSRPYEDRVGDLSRKLHLLYSRTFTINQIVAVVRTFCKE